MSLRSLPRWTAALALGALSCQRPSATEAPQAESEPVAESTADSPSEPDPIAEPTHPLELVPSRARVMLMARSPLRLAEAWQRERLASDHPLQYETLTGEMKRELGLDLLDPDALGTIGIDPSAPAGFAVLSVRDEALVFFGGLRDAEALVTWLERITGKPVSRESVGSAELIVLDPEVTLVLRGTMVALVFVDRVRPESPNYAREVARIDPARSLAHAPVLQRAHTDLPDDADLQGLLDPAGLIRDELDRDRLRDREGLARANQRLAEARQRGASPDELDSLQQQIQDEQRFVARRRRERQIVELLLSRTVGSIEGIGMAVDASDRGLLGRIHVALAEDSAFRELLVDDDAAPRALGALTHDPQVVISGRLDVGTAIELLSQIAMASGGSYAELNDEIREELRIDFDREIRPHLDGRATFVITTEEPTSSRSALEMGRLIGGILAIGIDDGTAARAALERVAKTWTGGGLRPEPAISGYAIDLPDDDGPSTLWAGVVADHLVVGTDLAGMRRLRDGEAGPAGSGWADAEAWTRLTSGSAAARLALHHRVPTLLAFGFATAFETFDFPRDVDFELESELPEQDIRAVPRGAKVRRLETQRDRAFDQLHELQDERRAERTLRMWQYAEGLGVTAGTVRGVPSGLMLEGGHYVDGGLAGYVETLMSFDELGDRETSVDGRLDEARARFNRAQDRLFEARRKEVLRAGSARR